MPKATLNVLDLGASLVKMRRSGTPEHVGVGLVPRSTRCCREPATLNKAHEPALKAPGAPLGKNMPCRFSLHEGRQSVPRSRGDANSRDAPVLYPPARHGPRVEIYIFQRLLGNLGGAQR